MNEWITTLQEQILVELAGAGKADLDQLELLELAPPDQRE